MNIKNTVYLLRIKKYEEKNIKHSSMVCEAVNSNIKCLWFVVDVLQHIKSLAL